MLNYYIDQPKLFQSVTVRYCTDYFWASPTCIYGLPDGPEPLRVVVVVEEEPAAEVLVGRPRPGGVGRGLSLPQSVVPPQELTVNNKIYSLTLVLWQLAAKDTLWGVHSVVIFCRAFLTCSTGC